jgi:D-lactate dehydrogenase
MISGLYKKFYETLLPSIPKERIFHDALTTLAYGTDASFYRLTPKLIIQARNEQEVKAIVSAANRMKIPITFRAAGTSLSGQSISDSVLVITSHGWNSFEILENGAKVKSQPGVRGSRINLSLLPYGRKFGPDPASIDSAMIGGIAANNASGMSCGIVENSYRTVEDIRLIFADGSVLDTSDDKSITDFLRTHKDLIKRIENISEKIANNAPLYEKIKQKYQIKNTTGYGINSFIDYQNPIDIIKHLIIGSEGTLAFISNITFKTVIDHKNKAIALIIYESVETACKAVQIMKNQPVSAVELMDRMAIRSVEESPGVPQFLQTLGEGRCALLVESRADDDTTLNDNIKRISESIKDIPTDFPYIFTKDPKEQASFWKIRKETLPTVAGMRKSGTTAIIEDICFPIKYLADATVKLRKVFDDNGYSDAGIFGHALEGNLHFMFNQDFGTESEVKRYNKFMDDIAEFVVAGYDGSLKAEHGTGRNMAPYVRKEWGDEAYAIMKEIKEIFDPNAIFNPGTIINDDPLAHVKNLKPNPPTNEIIDKCMECGFCEGSCVAEGLSFSPRQRVSAYRTIKSMSLSHSEPHVLAEMKKKYKYLGLATCATDSLCALKCPVKVDTGKLIKELRKEENSKLSRSVAMFISKHMAGTTSFMRGGLNLLYFIRTLFGKRAFGVIASFIRKVSFNTIPKWNEHFPKGAHRIHTSHTSKEVNKVVYFPSCITRSMGIAKSYCKELEITRLTEKLLKKAGYEVIYPNNLDKLCCGMAFSSKGFIEAGKRSSQELEAALTQISENGKYPILCDMSPCLYTMHSNMDDRLKLYEPAEFAKEYLLPNLEITPTDEKVAIFAVCSAKKLEVNDILVDIATQCAKEVITIDSNCCGFAGDRGFILPELNAHGLRHIKEQVYGVDSGYATSRTCEIGLSYHSGLEFKSILYLIDKCSKSKS